MSFVCVKAASTNLKTTSGGSLLYPEMCNVSIQMKGEEKIRLLKPV